MVPTADHGRGKAGEGVTSDTLEGRKETLSYLLTLMRGVGPEWAGLLPAMDVAGMEHLAWTLDALHYLLEVTSHTHTLTPSHTHTFPISSDD